MTDVSDDEIVERAMAAGFINPAAGPGEQKTDTELRRIKLTRASQIPIRPVRWVWHDRMPSGAITLIPGREGIGKSLTLVWLTAQITRGRLPGIHEGSPRPVFYAASEDSWEHTIAPRLVVAGADLNMVYRVEVERVLNGSTDSLTLPVDSNALAGEIRRLGVALLALDPLMSVINSGIDVNRDRELRTALDPLAKLADETGCAVGALAHFNKSSSNDASNLITGSRAFSAVARAVISIARDPDAEDGTCILSQTKNNLGRLNLPNLTYVIDSVGVDTEEGTAHVGRLRFTGESERSVSDILGGGDEDDLSERDGAASWLREFLVVRGGEAARADIVKAAKAEGISESTLKRARKKAGARITQRQGFGGGTLWTLDSQSSQSSQLTDTDIELTDPTVARLHVVRDGEAS